MGTSMSCPSLSVALAGGYETTVPSKSPCIATSTSAGHVRVPWNGGKVSAEKIKRDVINVSYYEHSAFDIRSLFVDAFVLYGRGCQVLAETLTVSGLCPFSREKNISTLCVYVSSFYATVWIALPNPRLEVYGLGCIIWYRGAAGTWRFPNEKNHFSNRTSSNKICPTDK